MKKRKIYEISIIDKTYSKTISDETKFYTSDTSLELGFILKETEYTFESAEIVLLNIDDRSLVTRQVAKVLDSFTYELEDDIIAHYGEWRGQVRFEQAGEVYVSSPVKFRIENDLSNDRPPQLSDVQSWVSLKRYADGLVEELKQAVLEVEGMDDTFNANELERQTTFETNESERDRTFEINETTRQAQELEREKAESQRQSVFDDNETTRQRNEYARIEAEQQREETVANIETRQTFVEDQFNAINQELTTKDVISAPEIIAARNGEKTLSDRLAKDNKKAIGVPLAQMSKVNVTENYTGVIPITFHNGELYGFQNNTTIVRSKDEGNSWETVATSPQGSLHSMYWTDDGEVLLGFNSDVRKSIGWSNNPQTATWKTVVTRSKGVGILPWGIDGDGTKFIVTEYSASDRSESRYVWISTDMGETFNVVIDKYDIDPDNTSHMHGVCYDKWADRFFVSHGHGIIEGVYWSDDDGATWNLVESDFELDAAPTTLTSTVSGIVGGSDSGRAGLYGIQRTKNPHNMVMRRTARWEVPREGVTGFAYRGVRDEETDQVYVAFKSDFTDISPVIMAGTATTGAVVWKGDFGSSSHFQYLAVAKDKVMGVHGAQGAYRSIVGNKPSYGVGAFDSGNISTAKATSTSIAIGQNVDVKTANEILIGNNASLISSSSNTQNVVIGHSATGAARSVVVGDNAKASNGSDNISIGKNANNMAIGGISIGLNSEVLSGQTGAIAIGSGAKATLGGTSIGIGSTTISGSVNGTAIGSSAKSGTEGVAIGRLASAGTKSVAIGLNAKGTYQSSVALGGDTSTSSADQIQIGKRHIELEVATTTGVPPIGNARLYLKDNAETGKQELCVRFRNAEVILATQP